MEEMESGSALEAMPLDVVVEVGKHLDIISIIRLSSTTKNYRQLLNDHDLCRATYTKLYGSHNHINESNIDWQLCRAHCYNRLKEPDYDHEITDTTITFNIDYLTNKLIYDTKYGRGDTSQMRTVAAELPLRPLFLDGTVGYYEITVTADFDNEGYASFGLTEDGIVLAGHAVGWPAKHVWLGYHGDDGDIYDPEIHTSGCKYGPRWLQLRHRPTVGCLVNFTNNIVYFTVDGVLYGGIDMNWTADLVCRLHPVVGTKECAVIEFNFGSKPFKYDLHKYAADSSPNAPDRSNTLIKSLVK